eukprot:Nk52_evm1s406 gene=Nk52_evmTU1s406
METAMWSDPDRNESAPHYRGGRAGGAERSGRRGRNGGGNRRHGEAPQYEFTSEEKQMGFIERLRDTYGFIEPLGKGSRLFFHYSELRNADPRDLKHGDEIEFYVANDPRNDKPVGVEIYVLARGTIKTDSISETKYEGVIEREARKTASSFGNRKGGRGDEDKYGTISYKISPESEDEKTCTIPYLCNDQNSFNEVLKQGDRVSFFICSSLREGKNGPKEKAVNIDLVERKPEVLIRGIVSSLKDGYGFLDRADVCAEIFFHFSELIDFDDRDLQIGDSVEFSTIRRQGKEIAGKVKVLPKGTVKFDEVQEEELYGIIETSMFGRDGRDRKGGGGIIGKLRVLKTEDGSEGDEIFNFFEKDIFEGYGRDSQELRVGDKVRFQVALDTRDKQTRATNISRIHPLNFSSKRETGVVSALKDSFGFIKCCDRNLRVFFHFSELVDFNPNDLKNRDEVEFVIELDKSGKETAACVKVLPKGTVSFEAVEEEVLEGIVSRAAVAPKFPQGRNSRTPLRGAKDGAIGVILSEGEEKEQSKREEVTYKAKDVILLRGNLRKGDKVSFKRAFKKHSPETVYAVDIQLVERAPPKVNYGFITSLKSGFGFIESNDLTGDVFFKFKDITKDKDLTNFEVEELDEYQEVDGYTNTEEEVSSTCDDIKIRDEVEYVLANRTTAVHVRVLKRGTIETGFVPHEGVHYGKIVKPLHDPSFATGGGLIRYKFGSTTYNIPFGIMSFSGKEEELTQGRYVRFSKVVKKRHTAVEDSNAAEEETENSSAPVESDKENEVDGVESDSANAAVDNVNAESGEGKGERKHIPIVRKAKVNGLVVVKNERAVNVETDLGKIHKGVVSEVSSADRTGVIKCEDKLYSFSMSNLLTASKTAIGDEVEFALIPLGEEQTEVPVNINVTLMARPAPLMFKSNVEKNPFGPTRQPRGPDGTKGFAPRNSSVPVPDTTPVPETSNGDDSKTELLHGQVTIVKDDE